jgi:hypothetical protein
MLSIFDEMSAANSAGISVYFDAVISLARQWIVRCGLWKPAVSVALSALLFRVPLSHPVRVWAIPRDSAADLPADVLVQITLLTLGLISVILIAIVSWSRAVAARRSASCHWNYARSRNATAASSLSKT